MKKQSVRRKKQSEKRKKGDANGSAIAIDRLSQLPQPVLHSILSLLSQKDAVRTSVLSKSWRYLWHGRLNVEFRENWFARKKVFYSFLDTTLQRYLDQNLSLQKFVVYNEYEVDLVLLQKWIPMVIMNMGVRSFDISFRESRIFFPLPLVVFQSESLVELHLQRCDLRILESTCNVVMLKNLQTLRLHYVYITDEIFEKIISGCPLIENLDMLNCSGFKSIKLHKHRIIKKLPCFHDDRCIIQVEDPHTLESFYIENRSSNWSLIPHKNMHFPHLKSLKLQWVKLNADTFSNFSSFFPCLNELIINNCNGFEEFSLLSSSIKRLTIVMGLKNRIKAFFDTPNILYFEYVGDRDAVLPSIKFTTTSNEWESKISLSCKLERSDKDLLELNKLLKALNQSHITLSLYHTVFRKKLDIDDSYSGFYKPVVVEHVKLTGFVSSYLELVRLNCFFQICHPLYIYMDMYGNIRDKCVILEYVSKVISDEIGPCVEEVSIEVWDEKAKEWHCVKGTSYTAMRFKQLIRFQLTWKEQ